MRILEKIGLFTLLAIFTWAPIAVASYWLSPSGQTRSAITEQWADPYARAIRITKALPVAEVVPEPRVGVDRKRADTSSPELNTPETISPQAGDPTPSTPAAMTARAPPKASVTPPKKSVTTRSLRKDQRNAKRSRPRYYATRSAPREEPVLFNFGVFN